MEDYSLRTDFSSSPFHFIYKYICFISDIYFFHIDGIRVHLKQILKSSYFILFKEIN